MQATTMQEGHPPTYRVFKEAVPWEDRATGLTQADKEEEGDPDRVAQGIHTMGRREETDPQVDLVGIGQGEVIVHRTPEGALQGETREEGPQADLLMDPPGGPPGPPGGNPGGAAGMGMFPDPALYAHLGDAFGRALAQHLPQIQQAGGVDDAVERALRYNRQYEVVKMEWVLPFHPNPSRYERQKENLETNVDRFLQNVLPTLRQRQIDDNTRTRSFLYHVRGSAKVFVLAHPMVGDDAVPFETLIAEFYNRFKPHERGDQVIDKMTEAKRRPGESIEEYETHLERLTQEVYSADPTLQDSCRLIAWKKIMSELPDQLQGEIYDRFNRDQIPFALEHIRDWVARHPRCSLHRKQLDAERKEHERKKQSEKNGWKDKSGWKDKNKWNKPKTNAMKALPPPEGWTGEEESSEEEMGAQAAALYCYKCEEQGHLVRDCPGGSKTQTVVKSKKKEQKGTTKKADWKRENKTPAKGSRLAQFKAERSKNKCIVCKRPGHASDKCFLLKNIVQLWKDCLPFLQANFLEKAGENPFEEGDVQAIREVLEEEIDWDAHEVAPGQIDEIITAALHSGFLTTEVDSEDEE